MVKDNEKWKEYHEKYGNRDKGLDVEVEAEDTIAMRGTLCGLN